MIDEEAAGWIAALGLERGPEGHVRAYPGSLGTLTYVLLTADRWQPASAGPAQPLVARLGLVPHVEAGHFRERWAARARVDTAAGPRPLASTIYYLLTAAAPLGRFHRTPRISPTCCIRAGRSSIS